MPVGHLLNGTLLVDDLISRLPGCSVSLLAGYLAARLLCGLVTLRVDSFVSWLLGCFDYLVTLLTGYLAGRYLSGWSPCWLGAFHLAGW